MIHRSKDEFIKKHERDFIKNDEIFKRLAKVSDPAALSPSERYHYDADVKNARDRLNQIRGALAEGRAEGLAEGLAEGRAEGRAEEKRIIAENLIGLGMADKDICTATGLSLQQIAEIRQASNS